MNNKSEYKVVLYRQTDRGYDVISPYQISETVAKEVYENVLGIAEERGNQGNRTMAIENLKKEIRELKRRLHAIREMVGGP